MVYEHALATTQNGIESITIDSTPDRELLDDAALDYPLEVIITFAVTTDSLATMTVTEDATIHGAFGGTGVAKNEYREYATVALRVWQAITGINKHGTLASNDTDTDTISTE